MAQPNLRVNGQNYETLDENEHSGIYSVHIYKVAHSLADIEPFDESLDRRIWSLADTRLQWHKRIAEFRRNVPIDIENSLKNVFKQEYSVAAEESAMEEEESQADQEPLDGELPQNYVILIIVLTILQKHCYISPS